MAVHGVTMQHHAVGEGAVLANPAAAPTGANALTLEELMLKPDREFIDINEFQRTADKLGWIPGKVSGEFSFKHQWRLGAAVDAVPELDVILANAFGTAATIVASTSVTYNQATFDQGFESFRLIQAGGSVTSVGRNEYFVHQAVGCIVDKLTFTIEGGQPVLVEGEGKFSDYGYMFGAPLTSGALVATDTAVTLGTGDGAKIRESTGGLYVQFGNEDNGGAGYRIDTTAGDATTIGTVGGLVGPVADGTLVRPLIPAATYAGAHLDGVTSNLSIGGTDYGYIKAMIEYNTGLVLLNKEATSPFAHRGGRTQRNLTGEVVFYLENEMGDLSANAFSGAEYAVELRLGGTAAGSRYRLAMPAMRLAVVNEYPFALEDEGTEVTMNLAARRTSGDNMFTIIQD